MAPWIAVALCFVESSGVLPRAILAYGFLGHSYDFVLWAWYSQPAGCSKRIEESRSNASQRCTPDELKGPSAGLQALTAPSLRAMLCGIQLLQAGLSGFLAYC